jgi:assimilatory nitrate reductase catalytic subunit
MFMRWSSPEAAFQLLKQCFAGQLCDITGIEDYHRLDESGGVQWPWPKASTGTTPPTERRLFEDGRFFTTDGRAKFFYEQPRVAPELPDESYPFTLLTGRGTSAQWHTQTRTAKSDVLRKLAPAGVYVEMNPDDARRLDIAANSKVRVVSRRGELTVTVFITPTVQRGQLFIPMHYDGVNDLTLPAFDPYSRQPSYKACAVRVEPL